MTKEEAIKILHPYTSKSALEGYDREHSIAVVEEACIVACAALEKLIKIEKWLEVQTNE